MIEPDDRQFLLATAWLFSLHGQDDRARALCAALVEADPGDGLAAVALADLMLDAGEAKEALSVLRMTRAPKELSRAAALLETKALSLLGKKTEAARRWSRYVESAKGPARTWVKG